jgi:hypothetical protein
LSTNYLKNNKIFCTKNDKGLSRHSRKGALSDKIEFKVQPKVQTTTLKAQTTTFKAQTTAFKAQTTAFKAQTTAFKAQTTAFKALTTAFKVNSSTLSKISVLG